MTALSEGFISYVIGEPFLYYHRSCLSYYAIESFFNSYDAITTINTIKA